MKSVFTKILFYLLVIILLLPLATYMIIRTESVQTFLIHKITERFSRELKTDINIGSIGLDFWYLKLKDVYIKDKHHNDIINIKYLKIKISKIESATKKIFIENLLLDNAKVSLVTYKNEKDINLQFIIDYFSSNDTTTSKSENKWKIYTTAVNIKNTNFKFQDQNSKPSLKGFDFSNLNITDINLNIKDIVINKDTIRADIKNITAKDRCGFALLSFSAIAKVSPVGIIANNLKIKTRFSDLDLKLAFQFNSFKDFGDFLNKVNIESDFYNSKVDMEDIAYFAPDLFGMKNIINISGNIIGKVSNFKGKNMTIFLGESSKFIGQIEFKGLPDIEDTYIRLKVKNLTTNLKDLQNFALPFNADGKMNYLIFPENIKLPKEIVLKGEFTGFYNDFIAHSSIQSEFGNIVSEISLKQNNQTHIIEYNGDIEAYRVELGKILSNRDLGRMDIKTTLVGSGLDSKTMKVKLSGLIDTLYFKNYCYNNIDIIGEIENEKFDGSLKVNDDNVFLDFTGLIDYSGQQAVIDLAAVIRDANLTKLNLLNRGQTSMISSLIKMNIIGTDIDKMHGTIEAYNTNYIEGKNKYKLDKLNLELSIDENNEKNIKLESDYIDADIKGKIVFKKLYNSFLASINKYITIGNHQLEAVTLNSPASKTNKPIINEFIEQRINYKINIKDFNAISALFIPDLIVASGSNISGNYSSITDKFNINILSERIGYSGKAFKDVNFKATAENKIIKIDAGIYRFYFSDSLWLDNVSLISSSKNDTSDFKLLWDNKLKLHNTKAILQGLVFYKEAPKIKLILNNSSITVNDSTWNIKNNNYLYYDTAAISIYNFHINCYNQYLSIGGILSKKPTDKLNILFDNFDISNFDFFTKKADIDLDGIISGSIIFNDVYKTPNFITDLEIKNFNFNKEKLGDLKIASTYDYEKNGIYLNSEIIYTGSIGTNKPLTVSGYFYPQRKDKNFDFNISLLNLKLKPFGSYLSSFASNISGTATGNVKLGGTIGSPELSGRLKLMKTVFKIDYLNSEFTFASEVVIDKNSFNFDNVILHGNNPIDVKDNEAILNGKITHKNFSDMKLDINIKAKNFTCLNLNQSQSSLYYGKAIMSGDINITGPFNNINFKVNAKTEKGTQIFIPLDTPEELTENNFITFVNNDQKVKSKQYEADINGIQLYFDLDITPEAEIQILFDPKIGDIIKARGNANMKLEITSHGDFNMFGDYILESGDYLFTLQNIINKKFIIQKGGRITFNGDIYSGIINLDATYKARTCPDMLRPDLTPTNKRIAVDCNVNIKDRLYRPAVEFGIDFPDLDEFNKQPYMLVIQPELNKQVGSILVLNSFSTPQQFKGLSENNSSSTSDAITNNSTELLSNQVSNWLSSISKDFDIGVNYKAGNQSSYDELQVALSTQLFNSRIVLNGNLGVGGENRQANQSGNYIIGDLNVEYKITPEGKFRIKAFNKSNNNDYLNINSPYTQGIGIFYRKDFDNFFNIFHKKRPVD